MMYNNQKRCGRRRLSVKEDRRFFKGSEFDQTARKKENENNNREERLISASLLNCAICGCRVTSGFQNQHLDSQNSLYLEIFGFIRVDFICIANIYLFSIT